MAAGSARAGGEFGNAIRTLSNERRKLLTAELPKAWVPARPRKDQTTSRKETADAEWQLNAVSTRHERDYHDCAALANPSPMPPGLTERHAISVLPSIGSLKALQVFARKKTRLQTLQSGFGRPVFDFRRLTSPVGQRRATANMAANSRAYTVDWHGAGVDRAKLSQVLADLPNTANELNAVARSLARRPPTFTWALSASMWSCKPHGAAA